MLSLVAAAHFAVPPVAPKGSVSPHPPVLTFSWFGFGWFVCAGSAARAFPQCGEQGLLSSCCVWAASWWLPLLWNMGSGVAGFPAVAAPGL